MKLSRALKYLSFHPHLELLTADLDELDGLTVGAHGNQNLLTVQSLNNLMSLLLGALLLLLRVLQHNWRYVESFHLKCFQTASPKYVCSQQQRTNLNRRFSMAFQQLINPVGEKKTIFFSKSGGKKLEKAIHSYTRIVRLID